MKNRWWKQIVAFMLALAMLAGGNLPAVVSAEPLAVSAEAAESTNSGTGLENDLTVAGNNSFGNLLASEFNQKAEAQQENNGYNIFSVEMDDGKKNAIVNFETLQDATLTVGIFDEKGVQLLASGSRKVSARETDVTIEIEGSVPQYFYLSAFLADSESLRPLCTSYSSSVYTKEMQEFLAKKTTDFDSDRVLNLDDDTANNFAVYADDTKVIEQKNNTNTVKKADDTKNTYVIENANSDITSLQKGEIFAYQYRDESGENGFLIVKVADISVENGTATIHGEEISMDEVFAYIKIDEEAGQDDLKVDDAPLEEGIVYNGTEKNGKLYGKASSRINLDKTGTKEMSYSFMDLKSESGNVKLSGGLNLKLDASVKLYKSGKKNTYLELKLDYKGTITATLSGKYKKEIRLQGVSISFLWGTVTVELVPKFLLDSSGKLEVTGILSGMVGMEASTKEGCKNLTTTPVFTSDIQGELKVSLAFILEPKIKLITDDLAYASITGTAAVELNGTLVHGTASGPVVHDCKNCIDGEIWGRLSGKYEVSLLKLPDYTWSGSVGNGIDIKICSFYYSLDQKQGGLTKCPYYRYKTDITVAGDDKRAVANAAITAPSVSFTTDADGKASGYLKAGTYTFRISADGYEPADKKIKVDDAVQVRVNLKKKEVKSLKVSQVAAGNGCNAAITEDGSLYMWGINESGQIGDGTTVNRLTPVKILENVESVSLENGANGAITKDGSLYMWGENTFGQAGDGTTRNRLKPVKVLSNVKSVYSYGACSAAITKDGSLYMWGYNDSGQLGDGTNEDRLKPVEILKNVKEFRFDGYDGDCAGAVTQDGGLYVWGYDFNFIFDDYDWRPIKILDHVKNFSLFAGKGVALKENGDLYSWFYNHAYDVIEPEKVLDNVKNFSMEGDSLLYLRMAAITESGQLYMWGTNLFNEIDGTNEAEYPKPVKILDHVKSVNLKGYLYTGVIAENGDLYMWGNNGCGQIGNGTTGELVEKPVKILSHVSSVCLDNVTSAAITEDGNLYMWGNLSYSDVNETRKQLKPVQVMEQVKTVDLKTVDADDGYEGIGEKVVALTKDGKLYTWGCNTFGQLGDGTTTPRTSPTRIIIPPTTGTGTKGSGTIKSASRKAVDVTLSLKKAVAGTDVSVGDVVKTAEFKDLRPDTDYAFYLLKSREETDLLAASNLLYISQCKTDSTGKLTVTYNAKEACAAAIQLVVGMTGIELKNENVSVSNLTYTGAEQMIFPVVTYKGKTLTEGTDYEVSGDIHAKNKGTYSLTVTGIGDYSGTVTKTYQVTAGSSSGGSSSSGGGSSSESSGTEAGSSGDNRTEDNSGGGSTEAGSSGNNSTADITTDTAGTKTEKTTITNSAGKKVQVTVKTTKDASGKVTGISETHKITGAVKNTDVTIIVKKNGKGRVLTAKATVTGPGKETESGSVKSTVSLSVVEQIVEAAGIDNVAVTQKVVDEDNNTLYTLLYNAEDVGAGELFTLVRVNKKTGEKTLVNQKTYQASDAGNISVTINGSGTYQLLNEDDAYALGKKILKTIKLKASSKTLKPKKTYTAAVSAKLNRKNVKSITFTSTKKSVASVNKKTGKVKAKKPGTAVIKARVTLKNGETRTVKMKIRVKK